MTELKAGSETIWIDGALGKLYGILQTPEAAGPVPLVILSHGFGANRLHMAPYADFLADQGFAAYSYDFGGGGPAPNQSEGSMLDMSVLTEAKDLENVLAYFEKDPRFSPILLMGASQGGFVSSYVAAKMPDRIRALILLYPAFVLQDDAKKRRLPDGSFPEKDHIMAWTVGRKYDEDAVSFDIYQVIKDYTGPVLIIHGDADRIVPLEYTKRAQAVFKDAKLEILTGEGHGFSPAGIHQADKMILAFLDSLHLEAKDSMN